MKPTIQDVADLSGLSVVTVSRYINGATTIREGNRKKIQRAMDELKYTPSSAARILSSGKTGIVGLLTSHISDNYINDIIYSINQSLLHQKYYLALSVVEQGSDPESSYLFEKDRVDGIIIHSAYVKDQALQKLREQDIPVVMIDESIDDNDFCTVMSDNYHGGYMVADYLIQLGHKRISHIEGPDAMLSSSLRRQGFLKRLGEAGLEPHNILPGAYSVESGYRCTSLWIEQGLLPTAIFAGDDQTAFGAINALRHHRLHVPRDISIVGYDDHPFSKEFHPSLTTVRQPAKAIGEHAVEIMLNLLEEKSYRKDLMIKPELVIRESTSSIT